MNIHVLPESQMKKCARSINVPHCVISICSPRKDGCRSGIRWRFLPNSKRAGLLQMQFHDLDEGAIYELVDKEKKD